jgi:hypothetical protein
MTGAVAVAELPEGLPGSGSPETKGSAAGGEALDETGATAEAAENVSGAPGCGAGRKAASGLAGGQVSPASPGMAVEEVDPNSGEGGTSSPPRAAGVGDAKNCGWPPEAAGAAEDAVPSALGAAAATDTPGAGTAPDGAEPLPAAGAVWPVTPPRS